MSCSSSPAPARPGSHTVLACLAAPAADRGSTQMKRINFSRLIALVGVMLSASVSQAGVVYDVSLNTSPLIGHAAGPFSLAFQFNDGSGAGDSNNTAILSAFQFGAGGSASGLPSLFGGASGSLAS